eukprot:Nitzschia sp. Nitz4//scaffold56_size114212//71500//73974//NITZ4_003957-RA/size114212-snap-gene-0.186-mRNA-1//-1//CDS//3329554727//3737//frame0
MTQRLLLNKGNLPVLATTAAMVCWGAGMDVDTNHCQQQLESESQHQSELSASLLSSLVSLPSATVTSCSSAFASPMWVSRTFTGGPPKPKLKRQTTVDLMAETAEQYTLESRYDIRWERPVGVGTFGNVYQGRHRVAGTPVAVKKISKRFTNSDTFQREMGVMLHLEKTGGHPSLCLLHEHFDEGDFFYLVFDLVKGGELFDQLVHYGAYSEKDASRMIRQVASALAFLHGLGVVHSDLKPENIMLSSTNKDDANIKIVDFGCAHMVGNKGHNHSHRGTGLTPAYCPPEVLAEVKQQMQRNPSSVHAHIDTTYDMWSLGVILYIVLVGVHPFDLDGEATSEEMEERIVSNDPLPIRNCKHTQHLSEEALCLLERLMCKDPSKRMTAEELLGSSWVQGKTASSEIISGMDARLGEYHRHQTKIGSTIFKGLLSSAHKRGGSDVAKRTGILEMAFRDLDRRQKGYISTKELNGISGFFAPDARLSLSEVSQLLSDNLVPKHLTKGQVIYKEGQKGETMYFLHSGSVEVQSKDGFKAVRQSGEFFGEEALMKEDGKHSQTVKCLTPVDVLEINQEYYDKYLLADEELKLTMKETDRVRQRERAKVLLGLQRDLKPKTFKRGEYIFKEGSPGDDLYIKESGVVHVTVGGRKVRALNDGEMTGEHAAFYKHKPYNVSSQCMSAECTMQILDGHKIRKLCERNEDLNASFKDVILRRDFKKAVVSAIKRDFPQGEKELLEVFNLIDTEQEGIIRFKTLKKFVSQWDPQYTDDDVHAMLKSLDLNNRGSLDWPVFKRIFSMFNQ